MIKTSVCRSQIFEYQGEREDSQWLPHLLGHEGVGEIVETFDKGSKFKTGQKVILSWIKNNKLVTAPVKYSSQSGLQINAGNVATFAEFCVTSESNLTLKPDLLDDSLASFMGCSFFTGAGMVLNQAIPNVKSKVLIIGVGGIGLSILATLMYLKIEEIYVLETDINKANAIRAFPIKIINPKDLEKEFSTKFKIPKFDFVFESAGKSKTIELGFNLLNNEGVLLFASHPKRNDTITLQPFDLILGKKIFGSWGGGTYPERDVDLMSKILISQKDLFKPITETKFRLSDINNIILNFGNPKFSRPMIDF